MVVDKRHKWDVVGWNKLRCCKCGREATPSQVKRGAGPCLEVRSETELSPWYHGLKPGTHYRAHIPGIKTDDCTPEARHPECTICHPQVKQ